MFYRSIIFLTVLIAVPTGVASAPKRSSTDSTVEGFTEPYREVQVAASELGVVTEFGVKVGEVVQRDQVLATLDLDVMKASLEVAKAKFQANGRLAAAKAELQLRTQRLDKIKQLREQGHSTQSELDRTVADVDIAKAGVVAAEEERDIYRLECQRIEAQIQRRIIRSPIDGVVAAVHKEEGEAILSNDPLIVTLVQLDPLRANFPAPLANVAAARAGQTVHLTFPDTNQTGEGVIEVVSPVTDAKSGTVNVAVVIKNKDGRLRSGVRCSLQLPTEPPPPTEQVTHRNGR